MIVSIGPSDFLDELKSYRINIFNNHAYYLLERYLEPFIETSTKFQKGPNSNLEEFSLAVIVDDRPSQLLRFCIINTILMSKLMISIRLYTSHGRFSSTKELLSGLERWVEVIQINQDDDQPFSKGYYNELLKSPRFWKDIPVKNILIMQVDSLLIEPLDYTMFNYDYIGAPFSKGQIRQTFFPSYSKDNLEEIGSYWFTQQYNQDQNIDVPIGNGGLSIRNRDLMISICEGEQSQYDENEDVFFSRNLIKYKAKLPSLSIARRFACEAQYYHSIGTHASHLYFTAEEQSEIYERHFKHLIGIIYSQE